MALVLLSLIPHKLHQRVRKITTTTKRIGMYVETNLSTYCKSTFVSSCVGDRYQSNYKENNYLRKSKITQLCFYIRYLGKCT